MENRLINKLKKNFLLLIMENNGRWPWTLNDLDRRLKQSREVIVHVAHLLEGEGKIEVKGKEIPTKQIYEITALGRMGFDPWYQKLWRFVLYDRHNLFIISALIISIISFVISFLALKN